MNSFETKKVSSQLPVSLPNRLEYFQPRVSILFPLILVIALVLGFAANSVAAIVNEPMTGATAPAWVIGGTAFLTASTGIDAVGNGWLRLTDPGNNEAGFAFFDSPFDISQGAVIQFDYATWGGSGADGYSVYLFDASYNTSNFSVGASGGSLGYAQKTAAPFDPGLSGGYIGVGIDEYGNYSNPTEGRVGGITQQPNEVGVRGPTANDPTGITGYPWLGGTGTLGQSLWFNQGYRPIQYSSQYRKVIIYLTPVAAPNYLRVDVSMQFGFNQTMTSLVSGLYTGQPVPSSVKIGYAASTGGSTNYHEIRNLVIDPLPDIDLGITKISTAPTATQGGPITYAINVFNYGPNSTIASNVPITDTMPTELTGVTWTCSGSGGATCGVPSGSGNINTTATLPVNSRATYTVNGTVSAVTPLGAQITNTASLTAPAGITDYNSANNSTTTTVSVTGPPVTVSGTIYSDVNHNGIYDAGDTTSGIATIYAKLFRTSNMTTALQAVLYTSGTGAYSFSNVPSYDNYTIILSTNNSLADPTPIDPNANWIYTSPANYTLSNIAVGGTNVTGLNFGLYNGSRISGKVINDNGLNGMPSNANDGLLEAAETGIAFVTVRLTNNTGGTQYDSTTTDSGGNFSLFTNTASANLRIYETNAAGYISVNANVGNATGSTGYAIAGDYIQFAYTRYANNATGGYRNVIFGDVPDNAFLPTPINQNGTQGNPVYYAHTFTPGSGGAMTLTTMSRSQGTWPALVYYRDVNCNGSVDAGDTVLTMPASFTAGAGTPICMVVMDTVPISAAIGSTDQIVTQAAFSFTGSIGPVTGAYTVTDTTTVAAAVSPVAISGSVYNDANHNGILDNGEVSTGVTTTYYAKRFVTSNLITALQVVPVVQSSGTYTFTNVPSNGNYTIIISSTNNTNFDPSFPSTQWIYTSPVNYTLSNIAVGSSSLLNQNFGLFNGTRIDGTVFQDDGGSGGSANANNGFQDAGEAGLSGVFVSICDNSSCTSVDTGSTNASGYYALFVPWVTSFTAARVTQTTVPAGYVMVNFNRGNATGAAANTVGRYATFAFTPGSNITGFLLGDVPDNTFTPTPQSQSAAQTAVVYYAHTFTPTTAGVVSFATATRSQTGWPALVYFQDTNCNGSFEAGDIALPASITATKGVPICLLVKDTVSSSATTNTTDVIVTQATFTFTNAYGPKVSAYTVTDTTTAITPNLTTSTKAWTDLSGGPGGNNVYPGDVLQYTITLINSTATVTALGLQVTDTISANLSSLLVVSIPAGAADFSTAATLDIRNIMIPPSGTVTIVCNATVAAASGTIPNTANITLPVGVGPSPSSATATIIAPTGNKPLYFYGGAGSPYLMSRTTPSVVAPNTTAITIASGATATWSLQTQPLTKDVTITGSVPVTLYLRSTTNGVGHTVVATLNCSASWGANAFTGTTTLNLFTAATTMTSLTLSSAAPPRTCVAGNYLTLTITNNSAAGRSILVYPVDTSLGNSVSRAVLPVSTIIAVNSINAYIATWPSTTQSSGNNFVRGSSVYLRPVVSDPFGAFDITSAAITIKDPNNNTLVSAATLTNIVSSTSGTNTYEYRYTVPAAGTTGVWTYSVLAREGSENTVSDTGVNTFRVYIPNLLVVKSSTVWSDPISGTTVTANPKAIPGAVMTYTITVTNTDPLTADNVTITDSLASEIAAGHLAFNTQYIDATYTCTAGSGIVVNGVCNTNASDADSANWNASTTNAVTVAGLSIPSGGSATVKFQAIIQ